MILVDSSVWIDYFKKGSHHLLSDLISENLVCINELILTELLPSIIHLKKIELKDGLLAIPQVPLEIHWESLIRLQILNLKNGINKVGIPDLIIAQQALNNNLELFSGDKHFKLIAKHTSLRLFSF